MSRAISTAILSVSMSPFEKGVRSSRIPQFMSYPTAGGIIALSIPNTAPIGTPKPTWISAVARTFLTGGSDAASQSWRTASGSRLTASEAKMVASVTICPRRFIRSRYGSMRTSFEDDSGILSTWSLTGRKTNCRPVIPDSLVKEKSNITSAFFSTRELFKYRLQSPLTY